MTAPGSDTVVSPFGDRALLVERVSGGAHHEAPFPTDWVIRVARALAARWPEATVVPGLASVLIAADEPALRPGRAEVAAVVADVVAFPGQALSGGGPASGAAPGSLHRIAVSYGGPDLEDVARAVELGTGELITRHRSARWTVAAVGFAPGFGYLTSDDPLFGAVPRRADPRRRVPAGSVALAAGMCAVYPSATPGGWQLIGRTGAALVDLAGDEPAVLAVGDSVQFVAAE